MLEIKEQVTQNWRGGQDTKERNDFKNKVMVQESQYTSDGQVTGDFNGRIK